MIIVTNSDILGRNIRYLRRKHWMTRQKLAALVKWDAGAMKALETGKSRDIDDRALFQLCQHFDLDAMLLMTEELKKKK